MKHFTSLLTTLLVLVFSWGHVAPAAAQADKTIQFVASQTVMEDDPNAGKYCFTLFSPDGQWKAQLVYNSDKGMFGTFSSADSPDPFDLSGAGKNYNYVRNPKDDMQFSSFKEMNVSVTDETTSYRIKANCLAASGVRYIMEGEVRALIPTSTLESDLGYAIITENAFYGTYVFTAENDDFSLSYGIVSNDIAGTFYRADILMPELHDKHTGKDIKVASATAVHTISGDRKDLVIDVISEDLTQYHFTMYNAPIDIEVTDEVSVNLGTGCVLQDLTEMYGCYQFAGQNTGFAVSLALKPSAVEGGRTEWTTDDIFMPYTTIRCLFDDRKEQVYSVAAAMKTEEHIITLRADILCYSGRLYHILMGVTDDEYMPEPKETVNINFGKVAVVDYSRGLGTVGIGAVSQGKYQMRICLNTHELEGDFTTRDIVAEYSDIMVVKQNTYSFHDVWVFQGKAIKNGDRTLIDVNMLATDSVLYHAQMYIDHLQCNEDTDCDLNYQKGVTMVAMQEGLDGDYGEYTLQFQLLPEDQNPLYPVTDGQVFSFYFGHHGNGIAGNYSYSEGTLAIDERHTFYENGVEIRVAPVAGTLSIQQKEAVTLQFDNTRYATNIYGVEFHFVGQNGAVYNGTGDNYLICIDDEGELVDVTEGVIDQVYSALSDRGYTVRKTMQNGRFLIATPNATFNASGARTH